MKMLPATSGPWILAGTLALLVQSSLWAANLEDQARLERDQAQVFDRLASLKTMMERLAQKLEDQGRTYKAGLLRTAIEELDGRDLEGQKHELLRMIREDDLRVVEKQAEFANELKTIYRLLLDKTDLDQVEQELAELRKALQSLGELRNQETALRKQTAKLTGSELETLRKIAESLQGTLERQKQLSKSTEETAKDREQNRTEELKALAAALEDLSSRQETVARKLDQEERGRVGDARDTLEKIKEALETGDRERIDQAQRLLTHELSEAAQDLPQALRRELQKLEGALAEAGDSQKPEPLGLDSEPTDAGETSETPSEPQSERDGKPGQAGAKELSALKEQLQKAQQALSEELAKENGFPYSQLESEQEQIAQEAGELHKKLEELQSELTDAAENQVAQAGKELESAAQKMQESGQGMKQKSLSTAKDAASKALGHLENALAKLNEQEAADQEQNKDLAAQQDFLKGRTEEAQSLAEQLSQSQQGSSTQSKTETAQQSMQQAMKEALEQARQSMSQSAGQLSSGEMQQAQQSQQEATAQLEQALQQAQQQQAAVEAEAKNQESAQNSAEKAAELAAQQAQIREQTRRLLQRLKDLSRESGANEVARAERAMARAEQQLRQDNPKDAEQAEREAEKHLEEAEEQVQDEEKRYENLRQEELMYRVKEKLVELAERSTALLDGIVGIDRERAGEIRVPRRLRPKISKYRDEADSILEGNKETKSKLEEDTAQTFPWLLDKNATDLVQIYENLDGRSPETGHFTQLLIKDVIGRYVHLLHALDEELRRAREMQQQQEEQQQQQQQQQAERRLVPPLAELQLLKQLEQDMLQDLLIFRAENAEYRDEFSRATRAKMLERMGHNHAELTELFDRLLEREGVDLEMFENE